MATQQPVHSIESQDAVQVIRAGPKGETLGPRNNNPVQPVLIDQQLFAIDKRLYEALRIINSSRTKIHHCRVAISTHDHEEQKQRMQSIEANKALYSQCLSMQAHCLSLRETIRNKDAKFKEYQEVLSKANPGDNKASDMIELAISKKEELEARITELESEKSDLIGQHQTERSEMIQSYQNALVNAADRIAAAESKISELEEMRRTAENEETSSMVPTASLEPVRSPSAGKRQHEENEENEKSMGQKRGPAKKGRRHRN